MSVTGFLVNGQVQKYDYESLDNLPDIPESSGTFWATYNFTSEAEITDAFSNNKSVMMKYGNDIFSVMRKLSIGPSGSAWLFVSVGQTNIRTTWVSGSYWNSFSTNTMGGEISNDLKQALLQLASKVAYIDEHGQTYYNDLYNALYPKELISISATFNQGSNIIYDIDPLTVLNQYLTVVANYSDGTTETIPSSNYTLSGNLLEGVSIITVNYEGFTDTFNVNVTHMAGYYTIVNNLTGCTTNNSATAIQENTSYTAIITASAEYTLSGATVTITMGGNILTGVFSNGTISIPNVTGNLVITVVASVLTLSSITAVYTQSGAVYDTDTLDSLKADLVVTAHYSDSSTQTVPTTDYTLSGTLIVGTSTITVSYGGKTTTFIVTVTKAPIIPLYEWDLTQSLTDKIAGLVATTTATQGSTGLVFDAANQYCNFGAVYQSGRTYELDVAEIGAKVTGATPRRLFMADIDNDTAYGGGSGLIYRNSWWDVYSGSSWIGITNSTMSGESYFNGKTLRVYVDENMIWHMYAKTTGSDDAFVAIGETPSAMKTYTNGRVYIGGSRDDAIANARFTGLRVYEGEIE